MHYSKWKFEVIDSDPGHTATIHDFYFRRFIECFMLNSLFFFLIPAVL